MLFGDGHSEHAEFEEAFDGPVRNLFVAIDFEGGMLVHEIGVESGQQFIALRGFGGGHLGVRKEHVLAEVTPEDVLDEPHGFGVGAQHLLGLLDLLAILLGNVFEILGKVRGGHRVVTPGERGARCGSVWIRGAWK